MARAGARIVVDDAFLGGVAGMAAAQAVLVHRGVAYDVQVDTTHTEALECARAIAARVR
jgi:chloramphenicol 3-O phosphotransferase